MSGQEWAVAAIAIVVGAILVYKIWRFFKCGPSSSCDGCTKECKHRAK